MPVLVVCLLSIIAVSSAFQPPPGTLVRTQSLRPRGARAWPAPSPSPRAAIRALDIQTFRDSWDAAANIIIDRLVFVILTNVLVSVAWKGLSTLFEQQRPQPRPSPLSSASSGAQQVPLQQWLKLIPCILVDAGGDASYLLPLFGEVEDAVWAPTSAFILRQLFGSDILAAVDFIKEALPFTDIIPVATIAWSLETFAPDSKVAKAIGLRVKKALPEEEPTSLGTGTTRRR